jgi:hypothetical protein
MTLVTLNMITVSAGMTNVVTKTSPTTVDLPLSVRFELPSMKKSTTQNTAVGINSG